MGHGFKSRDGCAVGLLKRHSKMIFYADWILAGSEFLAARPSKKSKLAIYERGLENGPCGLAIPSLS